MTNQNSAAQAAMQELKPCPFCGGPVELENTINSRSWWGVVCRNTINRGGTCAIQTRPSASKEVAIERWNMRAPVADASLPPMPPTKDRGPSDFEGYTESDYDWNRNNPGALTWLADNHAAIRAALASAPVAPAPDGFVPVAASVLRTLAEPGLIKRTLGKFSPALAAKLGFAPEEEKAIEAMYLAFGESFDYPCAPLASAPVATPSAQHFKPPFDNCSFRMCDLPGQCRGEGKCHHPASAPVTEDDEVERIRGRGPAYPYTPNTAPPTPLASAPVAGKTREAVDYVRGGALNFDAHPDGAPVAGGAVAHAVISYGRIQRLVVNEESAHEYAEQQRLNAEAAGWDAKAHVRPLVYGDAAPQASAVAGEAVTWEAVRQELAIFLMGATGRSSKEWHRPLDNASEGGALAKMRTCLAAPQASAEYERGHADGWAAGWDQAIKQPQADKDGGQQRAGDVDERAAFEAWAYRAGMGPKFRESMFAAWEARAALSAPQAEQGERDA